MQSGSDDFHSSRFYFVVILTSACVLLLEVGLTRIFSLLFDYHYSFLSISVALLGLGLGAVFYSKKLNHSQDARKLVSISTILAVVPLIGIISLLLWFSSINGLYIMIVFSFAPMFAYGIILAHCFKSLSHQSPQLYASDLFGASLGILLFLFIIQWGGIAILLSAIAITSIVAMFIYRSGYSFLKLVTAASVIASLVLVTLTANSIWQPKIAILPNSHKEMFHIMNRPGHNTEIANTRWSPFGRTDLIGMGDDADEMVFFVDGSAGSSMYRFNGDWSDTVSNKAVSRLNSFPGYLPLAITAPADKKSALIIGPGGGRDIHVLKLAGVQKIKAVEINGDLLKLARENGQFNGGLYDGLSGINIIEDEGRSYLRHSTEKFDVIYLSIPIIKSSRSPEAFSLSENYLFTTESFSEYLEHLTENGQLIIVAHNELEIMKLIFTSLKAFEQIGIADTAVYKYFYTAGPGMNPFLSVWKRAISPEEAKLIHAAIMYTGSFQPSSAYIPHTPQHDIPLLGEETSVLQEPMFSQILYDLSVGEFSADQVVSAIDFNLKPPFDDSPFFYNFTKNAPEVINIVIIVASILLIVVTGPGMINLSRKKVWHSVHLRIIFISLGMGFMLLEVALIQQFILFLGRPIYSLTVLLLAILSSSALGSFVAGMVRLSDRTKIRLSLVAIVLLAIVQIIATPSLFNLYLGEDIMSRILVTIAWLFPLGFFLGVPFPMAIRIAGRVGLIEEIPHYWGINGISSVLGSALAIAIAITAGLTLSLLAGVVMYLVAAVVSFFFLRELTS